MWTLVGLLGGLKMIGRKDEELTRWTSTNGSNKDFHKIMLPPCVKLYLTSEHDAIQRTHNTFSHSAAPNQTKLHLVAPHTIPASPEQHTLYVTLSSSLSSTIICPPQNLLAVLVLMFELLLCDINIRILLKTFPGFITIQHRDHLVG